MLNKLTRLIGHGIALAIGIGLAAPAYALKFDQIAHVYFFGDSLTDSGFNDLWPTEADPPTIPRLPVGKAPTFTTFGGYTWSQYIARDIKGFVLPVYPGPSPADLITNNSIYAVPGFVSGTLMGVDYAAGGSTTNSTGVGEPWAPSLYQQVDKYLSTAPVRLNPNDVYFIWEGANDLLAVLASAPPLPTELQLLIAANTAAANVANNVAKLAERGATRVVVLSLPNIGYTPLINELALLYDQPSLPADMKTITFTYNSMLNQQLGRVIAKYGIKILYVDVYDLLDNLIAATKAGKPYVVAGQSFKFVNYTDPACGAAPSAIYCPSGTPADYVFADTLHPTDMAHRVLSLSVEQLILNWK